MAKFVKPAAIRAVFFKKIVELVTVVVTYKSVIYSLKACKYVYQSLVLAEVLSGF